MGTFWALAWRSVLFLPFTFAYLILLCGAYVAVACFPVVSLICLCSSDWWGAAKFAGAWVPLYIGLRWWWRRERQGNNWGTL